MAKYRVWINQVNQGCIDVETRTLVSAMRKAAREWTEDNPPQISYVEKEGEQVFPKPK